MNPGGPPTPDKPGISVVDYQPGDTTSIFLNLRVADIQACYEEWKAKRAEFVTRPIDRGAEIRCYMRDQTDTSSRSASPPACCLASSPQSARRISRLSLTALCRKIRAVPDSGKRPRASFAACPVADTQIHLVRCGPDGQYFIQHRVQNGGYFSMGRELGRIQSVTKEAAGLGHGSIMSGPRRR